MATLRSGRDTSASSLTPPGGVEAVRVPGRVVPVDMNDKDPVAGPLDIGELLSTRRPRGVHPLGAGVSEKAPIAGQHDRPPAPVVLQILAAHAEGERQLTAVR